MKPSGAEENGADRFAPPSIGRCTGSIGRSAGSTNGISVLWTELGYDEFSRPKLPCCCGKPLLRVGQPSLAEIHTSDYSSTPLDLDAEAAYVAMAAGIVKVPLSGDTPYVVALGASAKELVLDDGYICWVNDSGNLANPKALSARV